MLNLEHENGGAFISYRPLSKLMLAARFI